MLRNRRSSRDPGHFLSTRDRPRTRAPARTVVHEGSWENWAVSLSLLPGRWTEQGLSNGIPQCIVGNEEIELSLVTRTHETSCVAGECVPNLWGTTPPERSPLSWQENQKNRSEERKFPLSQDGLGVKSANLNQQTEFSRVPASRCVTYSYVCVRHTAPKREWTGIWGI